jgi:DNA-binding response OmpR family regulator
MEQLQELSHFCNTGHVTNLFHNFPKKGILVIDDDPTFRDLIRTVGQALKLPVTTVASLEEMPSFAALKDYDIAVIDFNLEHFCGVEIAEYVDVFFKSLPVLIISSENLDPSPTSRWPSCIKKFVHKSFGPYAILQRSMKLWNDEQECRFGKVKPHDDSAAGYSN